MPRTPIAAIQGTGLFSPLAGQMVLTHGVVTGATRKGFFLQDPERGRAGDASCAVFVFTRRRPPRVGSVVEVAGEVVDYREDETDRPTTQVVARRVKTLQKKGPRLRPVPLDAALLDCGDEELARRLNALEGMLVRLEAGGTFVAGSNPFGDYVVLPEGLDPPRTPQGGVRIDPARPERWLPGFRIRDYDRAPRLNVGARLLKPITGPLNYRAQAYQIATADEVVFDGRDHEARPARLRSTPEHWTILTLNAFNLDPKIERAALVHDPGRDIDDDLGEGRYRALARDVVHRAHGPDLIVLQEMQDDDGAEITGEVDAERNYRLLIEAVEGQGGPRYAWAEIPPAAGMDGGQPGGNIRNGFLYDPERVELVEGSLRRLGEEDPAFVDSRKPLMARFRHRGSGEQLAVIGVHLASKRHQHPIFAPDRPGFDPRAGLRAEQAAHIRHELEVLRRGGVDWYVTGDFNDFEFSGTLRTLLGEESVNLVERLPEQERHDYNHRGISEALLHAVVPRPVAEAGRAEYEILHGNEIVGTRPGRTGQRATDHAYGLGRVRVGHRDG